MIGFFVFLYRFTFLPEKKLLISIIRILGYFPIRIKPFKTAFIHKSLSETDYNGNPLNNERLEYLGDAILGAVVADYLYLEYPDQNEGFLTKMRSKIVNGDHLSILAKKTGLDKLIRSNVNHNLAERHVLGDAFEAFIGAVYLDRGYSRTQKYIIKKVLGSYIDLDQLETSETNFKSNLIEWAQKDKKEVCFYTDVEPYDPTRFISYVSIGNRLFGSGSGLSKKEAEQNAAYETLTELKKIRSL